MRAAVLATSAAIAAVAGAAIALFERNSDPVRDLDVHVAGPRRLTVAFMGEDMGHLEPCGCTPAMLGGLARRPARLAASREPGVPMVVVSGGSLVEGADEYDLMRLRVILQALASMGCSEYAPSTTDARLGYSRVADIAREAGIMPTLVITHWPPSVNSNPSRVNVSASSASSVVTRMGLEPGEPLVVLSDFDVTAARALAGHIGGPTLILYAGGVTDPRDDDATGGPAAVAPYPAHGKYVGFAHLSGSGADATWTVEYRPVVPELPEDPAIVQMKAALLDEMRAADLVAKSSGNTRFAVGTAPPGDDRFVGNEACKQCHSEAVTTWSASKHSHAWASLTATRDDADPGCVKCHVVGYGTGRGFLSAKLTPQFADVGCEMCHGPRAKHVESRRSHQKDTPAPRAGEATCAACHDGEHDPNFDYSAAWMRIIHGAK